MADNWKSQSSFTQKEIEDRIKSFTKLECKDPESLKILETGMHVRYVSYDKKKKKRTLKMGGVLQYVDPQARFLRLKSMIASNIPPFSVQLQNADIYYKFMNKKDPKYEKIIGIFGSEELLNRYVELISDMSKTKISSLITYVENHTKKYTGEKLQNFTNDYKTYRKVLRDSQSGGADSATPSATSASRKNKY